MSDIPKDIAASAKSTVSMIEDVTNVFWPEVVEEIIGNSIAQERNRCLGIINGMEAHTTLEVLMLETIARRVRGEE